MAKENLPQKYLDMVGTKQIVSGNVFSYRKSLDQDEYDVKDIRQGTATVQNIDELRDKGKSSIKHPTFELLLKNDKMKKSQWSLPFAIREINLTDDEN